MGSNLRGSGQDTNPANQGDQQSPDTQNPNIPDLRPQSGPNFQAFGGSSFTLNEIFESFSSSSGAENNTNPNSIPSDVKIAPILDSNSVLEKSYTPSTSASGSSSSSQSS